MKYQNKVRRVHCPFDENSVSIRSTDFRRFEKPQAPSHWSFDEALRSASRAKGRGPRAKRPALTLAQAMQALAEKAELREGKNVGG